MVIVDTCIWSLVLRKKVIIEPEKVSFIRNKLEILLRDGLIQMIGPIRQEILSGVRDTKAIEILKLHLRYFPDLPVQTEDYELAADFFNKCRNKGIQGSHIDYLICAISVKFDFSIFTIDNDFKHYSKYLPIKLYLS